MKYAMHVTPVDHKAGVVCLPWRCTVYEVEGDHAPMEPDKVFAIVEGREAASVIVAARRLIPEKMRSVLLFGAPVIAQSGQVFVPAY